MVVRDRIAARSRCDPSCRILHGRDVRVQVMTNVLYSRDSTLSQHVRPSAPRPKPAAAQTLYAPISGRNVDRHHWGQDGRISRFVEGRAPRACSGRLETSPVLRSVLRGMPVHAAASRGLTHTLFLCFTGHLVWVPDWVPRTFSLVSVLTMFMWLGTIGHEHGPSRTSSPQRVRLWPDSNRSHIRQLHRTSTSRAIPSCACSPWSDSGRCHHRRSRRAIPHRLASRTSSPTEQGRVRSRVSTMVRSPEPLHPSSWFRV